MNNSRSASIGLTLALVGKRKIEHTHFSEMRDALILVFDAVESQISADPGVGFSRLTLITGLADGADQFAARTFLEGRSDRCQRVLGAILPCSSDDFARYSPVEDLAAFERAVADCAFVTVLRGHLRPEPPAGLDTELMRQARRARGDAFAAQADALLQEADILIAVDDPDEEGAVGGTRHTLHRALSRAMPTILLHLGRPGVSFPVASLPLDAAATLEGDTARLAIRKIAETALAEKRSVFESEGS